MTTHFANTATKAAASAFVGSLVIFAMLTSASPAVAASNASKRKPVRDRATTTTMAKASTTKPAEVSRTLKLESAATAMAWSPDGSKIATGTANGLSNIWDVKTGRVIQRLAGHQGTVRNIVWSLDGTKLATSGADGAAIVFDTKNFKQTLIVNRTTDYASIPTSISVSFSPDGTKLASGDLKNEFWISDLVNNSTRKFKLSGGGAYSIGWSRDGATIATAGFPVLLHDTNTGAEIGRLDGHEFQVNSVAWSPDGVRLASASVDKTVIVWNAKAGTQTLRLSGHSGYVNSVAWAANGKRLASASDDGTVKVWDAETGLIVRTFQDHRAAVKSVTMSPDGTRVASGGNDNYMRINEVGNAPYESASTAS